MILACIRNLKNNLVQNLRVLKPNLEQIKIFFKSFNFKYKTDYSIDPQSN